MQSGGLRALCSAHLLSTSPQPCVHASCLTCVRGLLSPLLGLCSPLMFELLAKKKRAVNGEGLLIVPKDLSSLSVFLLGRWSWGGGCNSGYYYLVSTGTGCERPSLFLLYVVW